MAKNIYDPTFVASLFDRCSSRYRRWSAISSFGFVWLWRRQCVERLMGQRQLARIQDGKIGPSPTQSPRIIDLMAGTGEVWPHLFAVLPQARLTAIDISPRMHAEAVKKLHSPRAGRITHITADALTTDLPAGSADLLIATFGLKTFDADQQRRLAQQIALTLRPGGGFSLIEASDPKGWILRPLYRAYLDRVLPMIERFLLNGAQDFTMIGTYTRNFGDCSEMETALRDAGLRVTLKRHFFGCATSVAGIKPIDPDAPPA